MKVLGFVVVITLVAGLAVSAAEPGKVSLNLRDSTLKQATDEISRQAGVSIVVDPKAQGTVTASLDEVELAQALDVVTGTNSLTWKKLQFARQEDSKVTLDQLKSAIVALATVPLVGLSVEDPASKTSAVFAKDLSASPDVSGIGLPEGYKWATVYVVLSTGDTAKPSTASGTADVSEVASTATQTMLDVASMTPAERQLNLTPEARRAMLRDQMMAMYELDPQYREVLHEDRHQVFREIRRLRQEQGLPVPGRGGRRAN